VKQEEFEMAQRGYSPAFRRGGPSLCSGPSGRNLWYTKLHRDLFLSNYLFCPLSESLHLYPTLICMLNVV